MSLADEQLADMAEISDDLGNPVFRWKGTDYPCVPSSYSVTKKLDIGGQAIDYDLIIKIARNLFNDGAGPFPNDSGQQKGTFKGRTYRIERVINAETDAFLKLVCNSAIKGA